MLTRLQTECKCLGLVAHGKDVLKLRFVFLDFADGLEVIVATVIFYFLSDDSHHGAARNPARGRKSAPTCFLIKATRQIRVSHASSSLPTVFELEKCDLRVPKPSELETDCYLAKEIETVR